MKTRIKYGVIEITSLLELIGSQDMKLNLCLSTITTSHDQILLTLLIFSANQENHDDQYYQNDQDDPIDQDYQDDQYYQID